MKLRKIKSKDVKKIAEINHESFRNFEESGGSLENIYDTLYDLYLMSIKDASFVAIEDRKIVGYLMMIENKNSWTPKVANISTLAVDKDYRRRGIARKMIKNSIDKVKEMGYEHVELTIDIGNEGAIKLYSDDDFRKTKVILRKSFNSEKK